MEEPQRSRHVARTHISKKKANGNDFSVGRTVYDDVFGGPPKYTVPSFPLSFDDYREIFHGSSTVPFLEFSTGFCHEDGNGPLVSGDSYADIFGGYRDDFLISFEELIERKELRMERKGSDGDRSRKRRNARVDRGRKSSQKLSSMFLETSNGVLQKSPSKISSISLENSDATLFSIIDNIPILSDPAPQVLHTSQKQLDTLSRARNDKVKRVTRNDSSNHQDMSSMSDFVVDACFLNLSNPTRNGGSNPMDNTSNNFSVVEAATQAMLKAETSLNKSSVHDGACMPSNEFKGPYGMEPMPYLMVDDPCYKSKGTTSLTCSEFQDYSHGIHNKPLTVGNNPSFNLNIQASCPDYDIGESAGVFFNATDINLQTHPSHSASLSRPQNMKCDPKKKLSSNVNNLWENDHPPTMRNNHGWNHAEIFSETHFVEEDLKQRSPPFFDVEVDPNSDAAASAAAMKAVMEEAKAKLKFLKESMARRGSLKTHRSQSGKQKIKSKEHQESEDAQEFFDCNIDMDHEVWDRPSAKKENSCRVETSKEASPPKDILNLAANFSERGLGKGRNVVKEFFQTEIKETPNESVQCLQHKKNIRSEEAFTICGNEREYGKAIAREDSEQKESLRVLKDGQSSNSHAVVLKMEQVDSQTFAESDRDKSLSRLKYEQTSKERVQVNDSKHVDAQKLPEQEEITKFTKDEEAYEHELLVQAAESTRKNPLQEEEGKLNNLETDDMESRISVVLETNDQKEGFEKLVQGVTSLMSAESYEGETKVTQEQVKEEITKLKKDKVVHEVGQNAQIFRMLQDINDMDASEMRSNSDSKISIQEIEEKNIEGCQEIKPFEKHTLRMPQQEDEKKRLKGDQKNCKENEDCEIPTRHGNHEQTESLSWLNDNRASIASRIPDTGHSIKEKKPAREPVEQKEISVLKEDNHGSSKQGICQNTTENAAHELVEEEENTIQRADTNHETSKQDVHHINIEKTAHELVEEEENTIQRADTNHETRKQDVHHINIEKTAHETVEQEEITMSKVVEEVHEHEPDTNNFITSQDSGDGELEPSTKRSNVALGFMQETDEISEGSSHITQSEKGQVLKATHLMNEEKNIRKSSETTRERVEKEKTQLDKERLKREREEEMERLMKLEEEQEREREREKDRIAVERETHEACDKGIAGAWDRAEREAVERATTEVRESSKMDHQEKAESVPLEFKEKVSAEKASTEGRARLNRAAADRAAAEARERAAERAIVEKVSAEARERMERAVAERFAASLRKKQEKDNEYDSSASTKVNSTKYTSTSEAQNFTRDTSHEVGVETEKRQQARSERFQRTTERAAKALAEKKARDILAQREQAERQRLAETLDAEIRRWSNGKEGNLRALISTLQYILGSESGWRPVPLTEVITSSAVKKAYRKATLCVHPDKVQQRGASIQQKYICEKVFDLLKEAWNKFNSEER